VDIKNLLLKPIAILSPPSFGVRSFVASLSMHEGAVVANYPFDGYTDGSHELRGVPNLPPDGQTYQLLASMYARLHTTMSHSKVRVCVTAGCACTVHQVSSTRHGYI
jgi:hypothetical protein